MSMEDKKIHLVQVGCSFYCEGVKILEELGHVYLAGDRIMEAAARERAKEIFQNAGFEAIIEVRK